MRATSLSKPLQAASWAVLVLTAIALLKPDRTDPQNFAVPRMQLSTSSSPSPSFVETPWLRPAAELVKPIESSGQAISPGAASAMVPEARPPAAAVPVPIAPDPGLSYLGRMEQEGRSYVFLGRGAVPQVVEVGHSIDPQWQVEKATSVQVDLRYLPLNELRSIAIQ